MLLLSDIFENNIEIPDKLMNIISFEKEFFEITNKSENFDKFLKTVEKFLSITDNKPLLSGLLDVFQIIRPNENETLKIYQNILFLNFPNIHVDHKKITNKLKEYARINNIILIGNYDEIYLQYIKNDDIESFQDFISKLPSFDFEQKINTYTREGSIIHYAAYNGAIKCFKYLILNDVSLDSSLVLFAVAGGNSEIIHILENKGLSFAKAINTSIAFHRYAITDWILLHYDQESSTNSSIPISIFFRNDCSLVYFLCNEDINTLIELDDYMCATPFYMLCDLEITNFEMIKYLVEKGADLTKEGVNYFEGEFHSSYTPLYALCSKQAVNIDAVKMVLEKGADVNRGWSFPDGITSVSPLFALCKQEYVNVDVMKLLLEHGASPNQLSYDSGMFTTPLYALCCNKQLNNNAIKLLLDFGADINALNKEIGKIYPKIIRTISTLSVLCDQENPNIETIKLFIERGADVNAGEKTPLFSLCNQKVVNLEAINLLLDRGADPNKESENRHWWAIKNDTYTPLYILCSKKEIQIDLISLLISRGADVNKEIVIYDEKGEIQKQLTPLYALCNTEKPNIDAIKLLIANGADASKGHPSALEAIQSSNSYLLQFISQS